MIRLEEITPENWRFDLRVEESQKNYVSDGMRLLARAYAYRNYNSVALIIYSDDTADESQETYREKLEKLAATGANMIYTPYEITTVAGGWHSGGGEHHVTTWKHAYGIEAVREWMFSKKL